MTPLARSGPLLRHGGNWPRKGGDSHGKDDEVPPRAALAEAWAEDRGGAQAYTDQAKAYWHQVLVGR
jgi:hypothetical protein